MAEVGEAVEKVIMRLDSDDFIGLKCGMMLHRIGELTQQRLYISSFLSFRIADHIISVEC